MSISFEWKNQRLAGAEQGRFERAARTALDDFFQSRDYLFRGDLLVTVFALNHQGERGRSVKAPRGNQMVGSKEDGTSLAISLGFDKRVMLCRAMGDLEEETWQQLLGGVQVPPPKPVAPATVNAPSSAPHTNGHATSMSSHRALEIVTEARGSQGLLQQAQASVQTASEMARRLEDETTTLQRELQKKLDDLARAKQELIQAKDRVAELTPNPESTALVQQAKAVLAKLVASV